MWIHKDTLIEIHGDGMFHFKYNGKTYNFDTLKEAKNKLDILTEDYYMFTQKDMDKLMSKLDKREQDLVRSLYQEIAIHRDSNYCEIGIADENWSWDWDLQR